MKVSDLKAILQHTKDDNDVMIAIKLPYATVGAIPMVPVKYATNGFDWESGKFIIRPEEELTPADRDFDAQFRELQKKNGWLEYEKANLQAEVKRLKAKLNAS